MHAARVAQRDPGGKPPDEGVHPGRECLDEAQPFDARYRVDGRIDVVTGDEQVSVA